MFKKPQFAQLHDGADDGDEKPLAVEVKTVPMIRPEDRSSNDPVIASVRQDEVEHWKKHGWAVKE